MDGLRDSQLSLQALDIFHAWHEQVKASLACNNFGNLDLAPSRLGTCLSTLKVLSVSMTDPVIEEPKYNVLVPENERQWPGPTISRAQIVDGGSYTALPKMLELCRGLEELKVVAFALDSSDEELQELQKTMRRKHMHHLACATPLHNLRKLDLSCMPVQDTDILTFFANHNVSLRELELTEIRLEGCFPSVVSYITGDSMALEGIRLENIHESHQYVLFQCDWEHEGVVPGDRDVVRRWGLERKADISYFRWELALHPYPLVWYWTLEEPPPEDEDQEIED
ncbi:hypothetical protein M409DRAFT_21490 [Zasmidium cellare ATCC 36951]|uniref:F-box domain-containing protein n=1 Tax=Zasmidium cellare ATCC 36951 TaxID=1080233 RepID=A0A6A6CLI5_ZASCE|nr:uncharacterized protein M409DRAFT_21490 [Zasmidium cellare ATCC 36951]KAF2168044.1 hypothetical protein M409DRAFT_21490 [Zasmidium cellare ATCC 36951]